MDNWYRILIWYDLRMILELYQPSEVKFLSRIFLVRKICRELWQHYNQINSSERTLNLLVCDWSVESIGDLSLVDSYTTWANINEGCCLFTTGLHCFALIISWDFAFYSENFWNIQKTWQSLLWIYSKIKNPFKSQENVSHT